MNKDKMDLERFGKIMEQFLKENRVRIMIEMPEGTLDATVEDNIGAGSTVKFYLMLNAISSVVKEMRSDMGLEDDEEWGSVVEGLLGLLKKRIDGSEDRK